MIVEIEKKIRDIDRALQDLAAPATEADRLHRSQLLRSKKELLTLCLDLSPADKVYLARHASRPGIADYISATFTDFFEQRGDRHCGEDPSILGGIALYRGRPVTVIGHRKGRDLTENLRWNFGMPSPEGYRKALRLMQAAEKFRRPIITFIDTPGAYPGLEAESHGQGEAIARNLMAMSGLTVPIISFVTGEGGSGGALALGVANSLYMLEHAVYSVLSPEGFAAILWKDAARSAEACDVMKLTAEDLKALGIIDGIIPEPLGGAHRKPQAVFDAVDQIIDLELAALSRLSGPELAARRYKKFRGFGQGPMRARVFEKEESHDGN
jgi:acetyl-CoA carboxylase carboxyl transferase subunit alpha